jgi:hypothetical protein
LLDSEQTDEQFNGILSDFHNIETFYWEVSLGTLEFMPRLLNGSLSLWEILTCPWIKREAVFGKGVYSYLVARRKSAKVCSSNGDCKLFFATNGRVEFGPPSLNIGGLRPDFRQAVMEIVLQFFPAEEKFVTLNPRYLSLYEKMMGGRSLVSGSRVALTLSQYGEEFLSRNDRGMSALNKQAVIWGNKDGKKYIARL